MTFEGRGSLRAAAVAFSQARIVGTDGRVSGASRRHFKAAGKHERSEPASRLSWMRACLVALVLLTAVAPAWGDNATPEQEYKKLIRVSQDIQPLGAHPFGENINLYDGSLSFEQTDVSESGNGPVLQLVRQFKIQGIQASNNRTEYAFGDWTLDLPRIETLVPYKMWSIGLGDGGLHKVSDWEVAIPINDPNANPRFRCRYFNTPMSVVMHRGDSALMPWDPEDWWRGYHLIIPGQGSQDVLQNTNPSTRKDFPAVTKNHWRFSCIHESVTANQQPGDGFVAHAPDGTTYYFNELVYRKARGITRPLSDAMASTLKPASGVFGKLVASADHFVGTLLAVVSGSGVAHAVPGQDGMQRRKAWLLVTQIQDRFGNTLTFHYKGNGYLTGITASDGRALSVQYVSDTPRIHSVTLQPGSGAPRTWTYGYSGSVDASLTAVTLPDQSQWHYDLAPFDKATLALGTPSSSCITLGVPGDLSPVTGTITHPSGLVGTFTVKPIEHARSYVPRVCAAAKNGNLDTAGSYARIPDAWYSFTITQRTFSGAGLSVSGVGLSKQTWLYRYSDPHPSWTADSCARSHRCESTVWTDVVNPDGSTTRHVFSNRFDISESKQLSTAYYAGAVGSSTLMRSETFHYASPGTKSLPSGSVGLDLQPFVNQHQLTRYSPQDQRVIVQDGDTYTWLVEAFNHYAQITKERRFNSIAGQVSDETQTSYLNDPTLWVLGLPTQVTDLTTGDVEDSYDYNRAHDTLADRHHFGQRVMDYTFNGAGQLASFTDADHHTTRLADYKRGIPQTIHYPDGTSQSLSVDDFGDIRSITDQAGATTRYIYDGVGRLTRIDYPADNPTRNPKVFTYDYVTDAERGIGPNHWRRTVTQGDSQVVTYFDATLRPILTDTSIIGDSGSSITQGSTYDWRGLTTFASFPQSGAPNWTFLRQKGLGTHTAYDALGRQTQVAQDSELGSLTTKTTYLSGARKRVTDPKYNVTTTSYQVFDTPSYQNVTEVDAPDSVTQLITRNIYGNPTRITQFDSSGAAYQHAGARNALIHDPHSSRSLSLGGTPSVIKTLVYDPQQRLCRSTEPESGSTVMAYDAAGNVTWSASGQSIAGKGCGRSQVAGTDKVERTYDAMNRVLSISYPDGKSSATFSYDARGNVAGSSSPYAGADWSYSHNATGQLTSETLSIDGYSWPFKYSYNANGDLARTIYPDGKIIGYGPDALGRPTKASSYATGALYYPDGHLENLTYMGGAEYVAEENTRQLLKNLSYAEGSNFLLSEDMGYDADANLTGITDMVDGTRTSSYTYDGLNRLTAATATNLWGKATYGYDALNNITSLTLDGATKTYNYDATNRLVSITSGRSTLHRYAYDARGNTINRDGTSLVFDQANRLDQVAGSDTYAYDATGHRVKKTSADGGVTYYAYSSAGQLVWEYDPSTKHNSDYIYLGKKLVAKINRKPGDPLLNPPSISFDANPNNGAYTVSWNGEKDVSFDLQQSYDGGDWLPVYSGTAQSKHFTGRPGGTYLYRVRECQDHCGDWGVSAPLGITPAKTTVKVPSTLQSGPFTITWSAPAGASTYDVQQQATGGSWVTVARGISVTSYKTKALPDGSYTYQVETRNRYGTRGWGATSDTVKVLYPPDTAPSVSVPSVSGSGNYTVSWGSVDHADRYRLEEQVNGGGWTIVYNNSETSTNRSGKADGSTYGYRAQACNDAGCGPWGPVATVEVIYPPDAPTGVHQTLAGTKVSNNRLVWDAMSRATYCQVKLDQDNTIVYSGTDTTYLIGSAPLGELPTLHIAYVRACNRGGCSDWSEALPPFFTVPTPTLSVPANSTNGSYIVSWSGSTIAQSYTLQEYVSGGSWTTVYSGTKLSKGISGRGDGTYSYRVEACAANKCSSWSTVSSVTVLYPPMAPSGVSVPSKSSGDITVSWPSVATAKQYTLKQQFNGGTWTAVYTGPATSWSYTLLQSGNYEYRVDACNKSGCSGYTTSNTVSVTLPPDVPTLSVPSSSSDGSYSITWNSLSGVSDYQLQQQINGGSWSQVYSGSGTSKSFSGMTNGAKYGYRIRACTNGTCGAWSATKTVTIAILPPAPTNVYVTTKGTKVVNEYLYWDGVSAATYYEVKVGSSSTVVYKGTGTSYRVASWNYTDFTAPEPAYVRSCDVGGCSAWVNGPWKTN